QSSDTVKACGSKNECTQLDMVLDALEQALHDRGMPKNVIHHSDRGVQYLSIRYTHRLEAANLRASVGTTGDSYDNALAE
ncbi:hypothetical protein WAH83_23930, partial [Acinetobacter baumannii]